MKLKYRQKVFNLIKEIVQVKLVSPGMMPKLGKAGSLQSRQAIVHSLAHTESWAIDLSWVCVCFCFLSLTLFSSLFDNNTAVDNLKGKKIMYSPESYHCDL